MPRRNRVDPWGDLHAAGGRGLFTGNRGCLVNDAGDVVRHHRGNLWITCVTEFRDWKSPLAAPNRWTPIFFLDDSVALAAGHRPCGLCRRSAYESYRDAVTTGRPGAGRRGADRLGAGRLGASELNRLLGAERLNRGRGIDRAADRKLWTADCADLPDGSVVVDGQDAPRLLVGDRTMRFTFGGWVDPRRRVRGEQVRVLTPPTSATALAHGFRPELHASAAV